MYDTITSLENLYSAWNSFKNGKQFKQDVANFSQYLDVNLYNLHKQLKNKTYNHSQYQAFKINDPKPRDIHKATVPDRIVHHLLYNALYPYFDKQFIYDSYSCRFGKGTHRAMNRFNYFYNKASRNNTKTVWVLKCDVKKFFASIDHIILKSILKKHIKDDDILWLIGNITDSFQTDLEAGLLSKGLPLGNLTSQLLVNIYMNEFD